MPLRGIVPPKGKGTQVAKGGVIGGAGNHPTGHDLSGSQLFAHIYALKRLVADVTDRVIECLEACFFIGLDGS